MSEATSMEKSSLFSIVSGLPLSDEQEEFRESVRGFLQRHSPVSAVRTLIEDRDGFDRTVWHAMADQLGLQGLVVPESYGGEGFGFVEIAVVLEEMGRSLLPSPYLPSAVLATTALLFSEDQDACERLLPQLVSGERIGTLAYTHADRSRGENHEGLVAHREAGGWAVRGSVKNVLSGHLADVVLVVAIADGAVCLFDVAGDGPGLSRTPLHSIDRTRRSADLKFDAAPARIVKTRTGADALLERVLDLASVGLAAEQTGTAARALEMAVEYAGQRQQFGRPIGSFQAIKHKCADMLVEVETARSAVYAAAHAAADGSQELPLLAAMVGALASESCTSVTAENIQIHGGVGYTWEHDAHLFYKRAVATELLFGDATANRESLVARLGI